MQVNRQRPNYVRTHLAGTRGEPAIGAAAASNRHVARAEPWAVYVR